MHNISGWIGMFIFFTSSDQLFFIFFEGLIMSLLSEDYARWDRLAKRNSEHYLQKSRKKKKSRRFKVSNHPLPWGSGAVSRAEMDLACSYYATRGL